MEGRNGRRRGPSTGPDGSTEWRIFASTGLTMSYGSVHALRGVDLEIEDGEFFVLFGPSAAGKTTTLRVIAGLEKPDGGTLVVDGHDLAGVPVKRRDMAMVFQSFAPLSPPHHPSEPRLPPARDEAAGAGRSTRACARPPSCCASPTRSSASRHRSAAASSSGSPSGAPSSAARASSSSTSRSPTSTPSCATTCGPSSSASTARSARPRSMPRRTSSRRSASASASP